MHNNEFRVLTIDTGARVAKLALMTCPQGLSVGRAVILEHLAKSEKCDESVEPVSQSGDFGTALAGLFTDCCYSDEKTDTQSSSLPTSASRTLIPDIDNLMTNNQLQIQDIDLVVVALGPGSFTGLRIGVVAAKTFAFATGCHVVGVDLMQAAAHQADWICRNREATHIGVAVNAGRGELLAAVYERSVSTDLAEIRSAKIWQPHDWLRSLPARSVVTGGGVELLDPTELNKSDAHVVGPENRRAAIETTALLGWQRYLRSGADDHWTMQPIYSRPSAAEEVAAKKAMSEK